MDFSGCLNAPYTPHFKQSEKKTNMTKFNKNEIANVIEWLDTLDDLTKNVVDCYAAPSVVLIYYQDVDRFEGIGSGVCVDYNEGEYFITAAHCLYDSRGNNIITKCWIFSERQNKKIPLYDEKIFEQVYLGDKETKDDDIAIFKIVSNKNFFEYFLVYKNYSLSMNDIYHDNPYYGVAIGFPANKNQIKHDMKNSRFRIQEKSSIHLLCDNTLNDLEVIRDKNLVLPLGTHTFTKCGISEQTIKPQGMSGGGLFTISLKNIIDCYENKSQIYPFLSGIIIEYSSIKNNRYYIAISIDEVISKIS